MLLAYCLLSAVLSGTALDDMPILPLPDDPVVPDDAALDDLGLGEPFDDEQAYNTAMEKHGEALLHAIRAGFASWDANEDGRLDRDELRARLRGVANLRAENERRHTEGEAAAAFALLTTTACPGGGDADGDGRLALAELRAVREALIASGDEEAARKFHFLSPFADEVGSHPSGLDANEHLFATTFTFADANSDSTIERAEMSDLLNPLGSERKQEYFEMTAKADFDRADADTDGKISLAEYLARLGGTVDGAEAEQLAADSGAAAKRDPMHAPAATMFGGADKDGDGFLSLAEFTAMEFPPDILGGVAAEGAPSAGVRSEEQGGKFAYVEAELKYLLEHDENGDGMMSLAELETNVLNVGHSLHHDEF